MQQKQFLLVGNPNVGKSTVFNALCNTKQKTGNYAGVTVASHSGTYSFENQTIEIIDLPGSYSLYPSSEDEAVFSKYLIEEKENYQGVIYLIESLSIKRGLLLFQQIQDLGIPILLVINQIDEAQKKGIKIDVEQLSQKLGVKIITTNAKKRQGIDELKQIINQDGITKKEQVSFEIPMEYKGIVHNLSSKTKEKNIYNIWTLLASNKYGKVDSIHQQLNESDRKCLVPKRLQTQETIRRYQTIDEILLSVYKKTPSIKARITEKIDRILIHPILGYLIFGLILLVVFQLVFTLASFPMDWIDTFFAFLSEKSAELLPEGPLNSLVSSGIIPGIGGIVIFAPQIGILLYLLYLLEDSGYMARVVYLMDRLLRPFGLNGKSIVPLVSGTACAIPAIMSTRNIENVKERLITILVTPFMTCSARLPVYSIIIALIIPEKYFLGIGYKALTLLGMYLLGFFMALLSAWILKTIVKSKDRSFLVMDLPNYKMPLFFYDLKLVGQKIWDFITGAGKIIFVVSVLLWAFSYVGPSKNSDNWIDTEVSLQDSYLAKMGKSIEPAITPLGYDWKMGVGIITSFAAREVFVGTLSTLYSLDEDAPEGKLVDKMQNDVKPNGKKVFSFATGVSILLFYAFAMQCIATIAIVLRETKSKKWTLVQLLGMSGLAYIVSLLAYQLLK